MSSAPCIFFQQGRCKNGETCRFTHASTPTSIPHPRPDPRYRVLCKFHLEAMCKRGTNCPYRHEPPSTSATTQQPPQDGNDTFIRVFGGALVRYGDGARVTNVSLLSEFSSVRLDGLAHNTTAADVRSILKKLGHDIEVDGLRIVPVSRSSSSLCSAYLNTSDSEFPKALGRSLIGSSYCNLKAVPVPPRLPSWASTRRARCNQLKLRWIAPCLEVRLFFVDGITALRVSGKFRAGRYKVCDTQIHCHGPSLSGFKNLWFVTLLGLPHGCSRMMIWESITDRYDKPMTVVQIRHRDERRKDSVTSVRSLLMNLLSCSGSIDFMTEASEHNGPYWTASAYFKQDSDALEAARSIKRGSCNLCSEIDLTAQVSYNSTFKVSGEIHSHVQQRLQDRLNESIAPPLNILPRLTGLLLSLHSCRSEEVAKGADIIEDIVAGDLIRGKDDKPFWVPQLAFNGSATKLLKEIQRRHGVILLSNRSKREIRCFGDLSKQVIVQEDVVRRLTEDIKSRHTIEIESVGFAQLWMSGVLRLLKDSFKDNVVSLNVTSNPKKLTITGSDDEYCEVLGLLQINQIPFAVQEASSGQESCSICFTPAEYPVVLGCGHTYCAECFEGLCKNSTTQADMSITCTGANNTCKSAIPLREIQAHVDPSTFEQLLESSFTMYIARRPQEFHYCPTPDCRYIYHPASDSTSPSWHLCQKCLQRTCRSCHANHEGLRCDQHQAFQAFEDYKRENSSRIKDCPKCQTTVEKIDGCNHVRCGGCKIDLCWVCLKTFENADDCYSHMTNAHGGIGIEEPEYDEEDDEDDEDEDDEDDEEYEDEDEDEDEDEEEDEDEDEEEEYYRIT
ncbi:hypothetical protein F5Y09DRAFT_54632 [Xylaria sp. FL1042]|nr:hypothetical protein F5Y09DRAFT_54632 [Xylaria sp. FL1042]